MLVKMAAAQDVVEGHLLRAAHGKVPVLLTRIRGEVVAISERCPHLGFSLANARCEGGAIECPWHGSKFDLKTGANIDWVCAFAGRRMPSWSHRLIALGQRPSPLRRFVVQEVDGHILVDVLEA